MDKHEQAKRYREQMGKEAAERQEALANRCKECRMGPGTHASWCRVGLREKARAEQKPTWRRRG